MKIVLAIDGSDYGDAAAELLARIPWPPDTQCDVVQVLGGEGVSAGGSWLEGVDASDLDEPAARAREVAKEQVVATAKRVLESGLATRTQVIEGAAPDEALLAYAQTQNADLVVVGARGLGDRQRFAIGRVTRRLVRDCPTSLLIVRASSERAKENEALPLRVLVALDASQAAHAAVEEIERLPLGDRAALTLLTVLTVGTTLYEKDLFERLSESWKAYKANAEAELERCRARLATQCAEIETRLIDGGTDPADEILTAAEVLDADLLVAGRGTQSAVGRWLCGSTSSELAEHANCSVWLGGRGTLDSGDPDVPRECG